MNTPLTFTSWNLQGVVALIALAAATIGWFLKQVFQYRDVRRFVEAMATNHLPHIYHALTKIEVKLGIESPEPPPRLDY